jgi:hypothetical protein
VVTFTGPAGSCIIDANQVGNATYYAAPQVQGTITVGKASQTITFTSANPTPVKTGATYTPTATASSGLTVVFTLDTASTGCTLAVGPPAVVTFTAIGTCVIDANQAGNTSYAVATQVQQTITVNLVPTMTSAVVTSGTKIVILYNENVNCPTTFAGSTWTYDSAVGVPGGTATSCSGSGTNTLTLLGSFNANAGSASLTYSAATSANAVTATAGEGGAAEANGDAISGAKI